jgi:hypothetical protein
MNRCTRSLMESNQPHKNSTAFEYFLYVAIVAETGLAAIIYKVVFRDPDMAHLRFYFAVFYFAFLAWAIAQLNMLHHDRKAAAEDSTPEPDRDEEVEDVPTARTRPLLGLTSAQLVIVVVVFATAIATFSWALKLLL